MLRKKVFHVDNLNGNELLCIQIFQYSYFKCSWCSEYNFNYLLIQMKKTSAVPYNMLCIKNSIMCDEFLCNFIQQPHFPFQIYRFSHILHQFFLLCFNCAHTYFTFFPHTFKNWIDKRKWIETFLQTKVTYNKLKILYVCISRKVWIEQKNYIYMQWKACKVHEQTNK